jgi:hypothetical protein
LATLAEELRHKKKNNNNNNKITPTLDLVSRSKIMYYGGYYVVTLVQKEA